MSYKVVIVEDEPPASNRLKAMVESSSVPIEVVDILDSVEDAVAYFKVFSNFDLIFMDIQLGDGLSFDIFKEVNIKKPIIFTTAYDNYALQAFKVNSVDYLLKPIDEDDLTAALDQFVLHGGSGTKTTDFAGLIDILKTPEYKSRFLVKKGKQLIVVPIEEASFFYSEDGYTHLQHKSGSKYIIDHTIDQLCDQLNPEMFHRINRKMIVSLDCIASINDYFNSRLKLIVDPSATSDVIVSRDRVRNFKAWLGGR